MWSVQRNFPHPKTTNPWPRAVRSAQPGVRKNTGPSFPTKIDPLMTTGWFWLNKPTVDGSEIPNNHLGYINLVNTGISYQPQLVQDFWTINSCNKNFIQTRFPYLAIIMVQGKKETVSYRRKLGGHPFSLKHDYCRKSIYTFLKFNLVTKKGGVDCTGNI